jgi:hypothetical protein
MKHSESFTAIAAALAAASAEFLPIQKNREVSVSMRSGGSYTFRYATLDGIVAAVRPALSKAGLCIVQSVVTEEITLQGTEGPYLSREELLETRLLHSSGEWFANTTPVLVDKAENSAQAYGSAITYARRYSITQLLCVVADEDDDGNAAAGNVARSTVAGSAAPSRGGRGAGGAPASEKQLTMLRAKMRSGKVDEVKLCGFLQIEALEALPKGRVDEAVAAIESPDPTVLQAYIAPSSQALEQDRAALTAIARCDDAAKRNAPSIEFIRYHLSAVSGFVLPNHEALAAELGEPVPTEAAKEWKLLSDDHEALWLAPSKGGLFTTAEREALRDAVSALSARPTTTQEG